ncbi:MAG: DUF2891 domain-containing protein [Pseudomonadota bacterium]
MRKFTAFGAISLWLMAGPGWAAEGAIEPSVLSEAMVSRFAGLAMSCIPQDYPNNLNQLLFKAEHLRTPRELQPAFFGCYDWHSSVHGHWLLVKAAKTFPELPARAAIIDQLATSLTAERIAAELAYFQAESKSWERMYGWAWLLQLQNELNSWEDKRAQGMAAALQPLSDYLRKRYMEFLPIQTYPVRTGVHPNTAFGMSFALDYAAAAGDTEFVASLKATARRYFADDTECPIQWEPSGEDFLSACLEEAALMSRVMPAAVFKTWLQGFLPSLEKDIGVQPVDVSDRSDPKIAHLDGLNLSRAWNLLIIANAIDDEHLAALLRRSADQHLAASLPFVTDEFYVGSHWLGSFALYALTRDR